TPFSDVGVTITNVRFSGDAILVVMAVPVLVLTLNAFLRHTDFGVAVRAAAESGERAALLGVPVRRASTVMWVTASAFTGLAMILRAPVVGVISGSTLQGPGLLLPALAPAVIAKMEDMRAAVVAAICVGGIEQP